MNIRCNIYAECVYLKLPYRCLRRDFATLEQSGGIGMKLESLHKLYVQQLRDLLDAEHQLTKALPKMVKGAASPTLQQAFTDHLAETNGHVQRLEQVFKSLDMAARGKKCVAMEGLVAEGDEMMKEDAEPEVMDAGLIAAAQRVEHYEIAAYGTVRAYANLLGYQDQARLLQQTLDEEGAADKKLTSIAEREINVDAAAGSMKK
jgi:ferritin-like metal-binding protein YciE